MKNFLESKISIALKIFAKILEDKNINWVVVASSALALHGLEVKPNDIDIMTDGVGFKKINELLAGYRIKILEREEKLLPREEDSKFRSSLSVFCINGVEVEVMADMKIKDLHDGQWRNISYIEGRPDIVELEGARIFVLSLEKLYEVYSSMGREKDVAKLVQIKKRLGKQE